MNEDSLNRDVARSGPRLKVEGQEPRCPRCGSSRLHREPTGGSEWEWVDVCDAPECGVRFQGDARVVRRIPDSCPECGSMKVFPLETLEDGELYRCHQCGRDLVRFGPPTARPGTA
jgi:transposase-like protein